MAFVSVLVQDLSLRHLGFNVTKDQKYWWQNSCSSMEREFDRDSFITSVSVYDQCKERLWPWIDLFRAFIFPAALQVVLEMVDSTYINHKTYLVVYKEIETKCTPVTFV